MSKRPRSKTKTKTKPTKALIVRPVAKTDTVKAAVAAFVANIQANQQIRRAVMDTLKPGVHYGKAGGRRNYLYQAGATMICVGFQVQQGKTEVRERVVEVDAKASPSLQALIVEARADLVSRVTGQVVWEGRWRSASTLEPSFFPYVDAGNEQIPGPSRIQTIGDLYAAREEVMTKATKRAFIDSARFFAGMDDDFTQDEELVGAAKAARPRRQFWRRRQRQPSLAHPAGQEAAPAEDDNRATGRQLSMLEKAKVNVEQEMTSRGWKGTLTIAQANTLMRECIGARQAPQKEE